MEKVPEEESQFRLLKPLSSKSSLPHEDRKIDNNELYPYLISQN